jgi:hypothetical protein
MTKVFEKMNLKDRKEILVLNAPPTFEEELAALDGVSVLREPGHVGRFEFALAFATTQRELDRLSRILVEKAEGDPLLWFAYPKGTSKRYTCDFNRDSGWDVVLAAGFETVGVVSIDEDWSALRFRRSEFVRRFVAAPSHAVPAAKRTGRARS